MIVLSFKSMTIGCISFILTTCWNANLDDMHSHTEHTNTPETMELYIHRKIRSYSRTSLI